ncbi:MAG: hypothetical protein LQ347_006901, partial [Umbilicaria vellea]
DESERIIGETDGDEEDIDTRGLLLHEVDKRQLLHASQFLFDDDRLSQSNINTYVTQYSCKPLDECLDRPPALDAAARAHPPENRDNIVDDEWNIICRCARHLSVLLIALAHVFNLEELDDLMINGPDFMDIFKHSLVEQLEDWNVRTGKSNICVKYYFDEMTAAFSVRSIKQLSDQGNGTLFYEGGHNLS